jgi:hypothetical protein
MTGPYGGTSVFAAEEMAVPDSPDRQRDVLMSEGERAVQLY